MRNFVPDDSRIMTFDFQIEQVETTHFHQSIEVFYVLEGNPSVTVQDEVYQMHPEDVLVINANKKHSYRSSDEVLIGYVEINFRMLGDLLGTDHLFFWCNSVLNKTAAYDDLRSALKKIFGQYFDRSGYGKVALQGMYYELLEVLIGSFMVSSDDRRFEEEHSQDEQRVQEIVNYIHSNYRKKISLQELGDALYLSVPYLSKYIKRKMGMNFVDYVNNIRLFHAVDDLLYTNNSITSIALENGFPNVASLTRMLKTAYNMTPSEYRQKMKESGTGDQGIAQGGEKEALKRRVTDYLDNKLVQEPQDLDYGDSYIVTDAEQRESYDRFWNRMINIGRTEDLLRSDMQEQIRTLHDELGFTYVRVWDLIGGSMLLDRAGNKGEYNFNRVDSAFEFLIRNGLKPYLEL
ncbi:MAG: helix-turn-helix domain-containing protein, partial [Blautia sp.]|nr:helix-turn-helix domain-containing protein [Blautia sp.]